MPPLSSNRENDTFKTRSRLSKREYLLRGGCAGANDEIDAGKDQEGGEEFLPGEDVETGDDAHDGGDDGLEIGIHAHQRGADALLAEWDEEVSDKGGEENEKSDFPEHVVRKRREIGRDQFPGGERQREQQREKEGPLHEGYHAIAGDELAEGTQVEGEAQAVEHQHHEAQRLSRGTTNNAHQ